MKTSHSKGIILGLSSALAFAIYISINRYVYLHYPVQPFQYTVTFFSAAACFGALSLLFSNRKKLPSVFRKDTLPVAANGLLTGLGLGLFVVGQKYTTAVNASILAVATIITTAVYANFLLKERFRKSQVIWLVVLFIGTYFAIVGTHLLNFNKGDLVIAFAAVVLGLTNVISKILMKKHSSDFISDIRLVSAGLLFIVIGLIVVGSSAVVTTVGLWPIVAGFFLWLTIKFFYATMDILGPNQGIVIVNAHPIITPIIGILLLSEPYNLAKLVGSIVIIVSVYFITKKK